MCEYNSWQKKNINIIKVVWILLFTVQLVIASTRKIRYAAELNHIPQGATIVAMGDAGVALPISASSAFWNPSSPAFLTWVRAAAEYGRLYGGLSQTGCFSLLVPLQKQTAISAIYIPFLSDNIEYHRPLEQSVVEMEETGNWPSGEPEGFFRNDQHLLGFSIARIFKLPVPRPTGFNLPFPVDFAIGSSVKWYWQYMNPTGITRMGMNANLDIGMLLRIGADYDLKRKRVSREILFGVAVKDVLPSRVIWMYTVEPYQEIVDMSSYFGTAYIDKSGFFPFDWIVCAAIKKSYTLTYHAGAEVTLFEIISFRAGLSEKVPTLGSGLKYKRYSLDYAFRFDEIDYSPVRLSIEISF